MIAAGGTAGHVLPALAVAEALTSRGVFVTFAGSPDRVEAQLVPEAGFELDTFRVSGFERQGAADQFYRAQVDQHLHIGVAAMELLRTNGLHRLHSRKLRSFAEVAFQ